MLYGSFSLHVPFRVRPLMTMQPIKISVVILVNGMTRKETGITLINSLGNVDSKYPLRPCVAFWGIVF